MKILFLDDEEIRFEIFKKRTPRFPEYDHQTVELVYVKNLEECVVQLNNHLEGKDYFDIIHFDHDLYEPTTNTWYSSAGLAESFAQACPKERKPKMVIIHSINPQGAWTLYHSFCKITKTFICPFRLENFEEYQMAMKYLKNEEKELNAKLQKT